MPFGAISASGASGTCFASGTVVITTPTSWSDLQCVHTGDIIITGSGSFTMLGSSLAETGSITANESSALVIQSSTINLSSGSPPVSTGGISSSGLANVVVNSSKVTFPSNSTVAVEGSSLYSYNSTFTFANSGESHAVHLEANSSTIISSQLVATNVTGIFLGNSSSTNSETSLVSSSITESGLNINQSLRISGSSSIQILGSTINNIVSTESSSQALVFVGGGLVTINKTQILASDQGAVGFTPNSTSILNIVGSSGIQIAQSKLVSGNNGLPGVYQNSQLSLTSNTNITIVGSTVQSVGLVTSLAIAARTPPLIAHYVTINQSIIQTNQSPGSVSIAVGYGLILNDTRIDVLPGTLSLNIYELWATDSNITSGLVFSGGAIELAYLYNTTATSMTVLNSASFYAYSWFIVHTVSSSNGEPLGNCTINIVNPSTGSVDVSANTSPSGWAKIPVLHRDLVSSVSTTTQFYIVEATKGSLRSNQQSILSNQTSYLTLSLGPPADSSSNFTQLTHYTYQLLFGLAGQPETISLYSNADPLNFYNNATFSELDFSTVGSSGYNFTFIFVYPRDLSSTPLSVKVDGVPLNTVKTTSNATDYIETFSVPSGQHKISVTYIPPLPANTFGPSPVLNPGIIAEIGLIIAAAGGLILMIIFVRRRGQKAASFGQKLIAIEEKKELASSSESE